MPVKGGRGVDGRSVDYRGSHGFKGERRGISRHQQSMKLRKLTANYLAMRRDHKNTTEPYKGIGSFYRDTTKILRLPPTPPPPPPVISVPTNFFSGSVASEKKRRCNDKMYSDNWSLPTEEIFRVRSKNRLVANLPVVDFRFQPREMPTPKPLNT